MVTQYVCDKCGKIFNPSLFGMYTINSGESFDFCKECNKDFKKWLEDK